MNWEIKCYCEQCERLSGFSEGPGGKAPRTFVIFNLKTSMI